jgi:hypothetical protein
VAPHLSTRLAGVGLVVASLAYACTPELVIGEVGDDVGTEACPLPDGEGGAPSIEEKVVEIGWETSYENGFCDYQQALGFCYPSMDGAEASYSIVDAPVRSGTSAAAFSVVATPNTSQTRCFLEGVLPRDAVYGAWFFVPALARNTGNWNLVYFQGIPGPTSGLWDVSLRNTADGNLELYVFSHRGEALPHESIPVPIGRWFHVEFRLLRATDATGAVGLYQDGVPITEATGIVTDAYDVHQWYVGNLADALEPAESTIYVDDVTIRERREP